MGIAEKTSREEAKAKTRQKLVDAAISLLTEEGEQRFSMNRIAHKAGIAQPSFYTHFKDLQELMAEVREQVRSAYFQPFMNAIESTLIVSQPEDYRQIIERIIQLTFEGTLANIEVFRLIVRDKQPGGTAFNGQLHMLSDELRDAWIEFMLANTSSVDGLTRDPEESALYVDSIFALIESLVLGYSDGKYSDKQKVIDLLVDFTLEHISD